MSPAHSRNSLVRTIPLGPLLPFALLAGFVLLASLTMPAPIVLAQVDPDPLDHVYVGYLDVQVIGANPYIQGNCRMDVEVGRDGIAIISAGELSYHGSMDLEDGCLLERSGTWELDPYGHHLNGPPEHLAVGENTVYQEHVLIECPPPIGIVMDEYPDGYWDGGLAFDWNEAVLGEAMIEATNEMGDTIVWTLGLVVQTSSEKTTWSVLKARYRN